MSTPVLVTGGSGYFGALLVEELLRQGETVRNFDLIEPDAQSDAVEFIQGDIRDAEAIGRSCKGCEVVYHCVGQNPLARDSDLLHSVNVIGWSSMLKAAHEAGVRKLVVISSTAVYGIPERNPVSETDVPHPAEEYGAAKVECERIAREFHEKTGLDITILRPTTILGLGRLGIFQLLFEWVLTGANAYVLGKGDNRYAFVHGLDVVNACILAARRPGFAVYNIGAEDVQTMRETIQALVDHAGKGARVRSLPKRPALAAMSLLSKARLAPFAPFHWIMFGESIYFDLSRPKEELGWEPEWSNARMICDSYDWYLKYREGMSQVGGRSLHRSPVKQGLLSILRWFS